MYAIIETGGKQFKVAPGMALKLQKLTAEPGAEVILDKVLLIGGESGSKVGAPYVAGAKVAVEVLEHGRDKKVIVFHKWRRNDSFKKQGHRQDYTAVRVKSIEA